jgi:hypothetical protein
MLKKPITKIWAGGVPQGEGPEFKPQCCKKKKKIIWKCKKPRIAKQYREVSKLTVKLQ